MSESGFGALFRRVKDALDPDRALQASVSALIEAAAMRSALDPKASETWSVGEPLKLLFAGYVGTRNTGADVRVEEMIRQFRAILGDDNIELSIMTVDEARTAGYFRTVRQIPLPPVFPKFLFDECPKHHGVIACEGSMFKSKFANALSTFMAGALGMASAENKLSVGYGAEAGAMDKGMSRFVAKHCKHSLVICRNEPSREVLGRLGVRTTSGTDTAWTFEPAPAEVGERLLKKAGWDGEAKVMAICPINPFWWPVKPDIVKYATNRLTGQHKEDHYKSIYFHKNSPEVRKQNDAYLDGLARAIEVIVGEEKVFPILVGMERLDRMACDRLAAKLKCGEPPRFISDDYDMYELVSVLRRCSLMASSRYHAIVTSMPGLVPSCGVTMDERIRNLMNDRGHPDLFLEVDDPRLSERLIPMLRRLIRDGEQISEDIARALPKQLELMGQMGIDFVDELTSVYPDFPVDDRARDWQNFLPPLSPELERLLEARV